MKTTILLTISICSTLLSENLPAGNAANSFSGSDKETSASIAGSIGLNAVEVPASVYLSSASKRHYLSCIREYPDYPFGAYEKLLDRAKSTYPTRIEDITVGGIRAKLIIPENGIAKQNKDRVLINVHGGGFACNEQEQLLESIPIASVTRIEVVSINYRCLPDNKYPAAREDVTSVYKSLLAKYAPHNVGIYGCSAGGILTAESVAWFRREKLPAPGAVGLFCAADAVGDGDSRYTWGKQRPPVSEEHYFDGINAADPLVSPTLYPDQLKEFPPTLLVTGSRDFLESSVVVAHTQLVKAGVYAELHVWEGMGHAFFFDVDMPESKEMYDVTAKFFNTYLGKN